MIAHESTVGIRIQSIRPVPILFDPLPSLEMALLSIAERIPTYGWDPRTVGTMVFATDACSDVLEYLHVGSDSEQICLSLSAPHNSGLRRESKEGRALTMKDSFESFQATVVVIRNKPGKKQDSLPKLFRRCAQFVRDNELSNEDVESIRYVAATDKKFRLYPELHLTVLRLPVSEES